MANVPVISTLLPKDARERLIAASKVGTPGAPSILRDRAINHAMQEAKRQYPHLFKEQ